MRRMRDSFNSLRPSNKFAVSRLQMFGAVVITAALGISLLLASHAATFTTTSEIEDGAKATGAATVFDDTASNGEGVIFGLGSLKNRAFPDKRVWAHIIPQGLPNWSQGADGTNQYGDLYPLDLVNGTYYTPARSTTGMPRALQAGITGVQILQYSANNGSDFVSDWMKQADPTWGDSDPNNNFEVAPCLSGVSEDDAVRLIEQYAQAAAGHPSAAKINGKYVIYTYGASQLTVANWNNIKQRVAAAGVQVYIVGDLTADAANRQYTDPARTTVNSPYFAALDASYSFDILGIDHWSSLMTMLNSSNRNYAGGFMPGYDRETCDRPNCATIDAQETKLFRQALELGLSSGLQWVNEITWNDMVERTDIQADSNWNKTRADISAFYSAKLRGIAFPNPTAQLYITTPQQITLGDSVRAEGLVLNGGAQPVSITTQLVDQAGKPFGLAVTNQVSPANAGDATTPASFVINSMPAGHYLRAQATMRDSNGNVLQQVASAPILIYNLGDTPSPRLTRLYYSIPAYAALPATPTLSVAGNPSLGSTNATVTGPPGDSIRFSEVLQNTRQVANGFTTSPFTTTVPMNSRTIIGGETQTASAKGFYVGRIIDEQERVGYSNPAYYGN